MKRHYHIYSLIIILTCVLGSCNNDEDVDKAHSIFSTEEVERAMFDKWILDNYTNTYNIEKLKTKYNDIKKTMFLPANDMVQELKNIFAECGIAFEVVQHFTGAPVQGFIQKRNEKVILCMTIRQAYSDIFWFTLFHEIGHLINDDFSNQYIDYQFIESEEERDADNFARNMLINQSDYEDFIKKGNMSLTEIKKFAETQNVKPGVIIGRIQKDMNNYSFMTRYREKYKWSN